jgi:hypothetical protein
VHPDIGDGGTAEVQAKRGDKNKWGLFWWRRDQVGTKGIIDFFWKKLR